MQGTTRLVRGSGNSSYAAHETAYADDLHAGGYTAADIQRKADIVSAFCVVMGLEISVNKLRRFVWAATGGNKASFPDMIIRGINWTATPIPAQTEGCLTYLGGLYDLKRRDRSALEEMKEVARTHCAEVNATKATSITKLACANMTTLNKVRYKAKLTSASLLELRDIDKQLFKFHKYITKNMNSFPYDLMYIPSTLGGVGINRFSDLVQQDKMGMLFHGLACGGDLKAAVEGLLHRASRLAHSTVPTGYEMQLLSKSKKRYWLRSILEWLEESQLSLCIGGRRNTLGELRGSLADCLQSISTTQIRQLHKLNIRHVGDIIHVEADGSRIWRMDPSVEWLLEHLPRTAPNSDDYLLWPGQAWQVYDMEESQIVEIMDIASNDNIRVRHWNPVEGEPNRLLMGDTTHVTHTNLFAGMRVGHRLDIIKTGKNSGKSANLRHTPLPRSNIAVTEEVPLWVEQTRQWVDSAPQGFIPCIHTDGSYNEGNSTMEAIFNDSHKRITASAGLVIMHDGPDWRRFPQLVLHLKDGASIDTRSAYTMEYIALAAALRLQEHGISVAPVSTDAKAVLRTIHNRKQHLLKPDCTHRVLLQSIDRSLQIGARMPVWTRGHPEKREPDRTKWTVQECGNHLADRAAAHNRGQFLSFSRTTDGEQVAEPTWITVHCMDIVSDCVREGDIYWGDSLGKPVCLNGLMDTIYCTRLHSYLTNRDLLRNGLPRWLDGTPRLAATIFNGTDKSVSTAAQTCRIIFDKNWHGGNRGNSVKNNLADKTEMMKCHMCGDIDSQDHWVHYCSHPNVKAIRGATMSNLETLAGQLTDSDTTTKSQYEIHARLVRTIRKLIDTVDCPSRIWTSNWNGEMILALSDTLKLRTVNKKVQASLRRTVIDAGTILAEGTREILEVRHSVQAHQTTMEPSITLQQEKASLGDNLNWISGWTREDWRPSKR